MALLLLKLEWFLGLVRIAKFSVPVMARIVVNVRWPTISWAARKGSFDENCMRVFFIAHRIL